MGDYSNRSTLFGQLGAFSGTRVADGSPTVFPTRDGYLLDEYPAELMPHMPKQAFSQLLKDFNDAVDAVRQEERDAEESLKSMSCTCLILGFILPPGLGVAWSLPCVFCCLGTERCSYGRRLKAAVSQVDSAVRDWVDRNAPAVEQQYGLLMQWKRATAGTTSYGNVRAQWGLSFTPIPAGAATMASAPPQVMMH